MKTVKTSKINSFQKTRVYIRNKRQFRRFQKLVIREMRNVARLSYLNKVSETLNGAY